MPTHRTINPRPQKQWWQASEEGGGPNWGGSAPGDTEPCLGTSVVVMTGGLLASSGWSQGGAEGDPQRMTPAPMCAA